MEELTERQAQVLDFVAGFIKRKKYSPKLSEIGQAFGIGKSAVQEHLIELRRKGRIDWIDGDSRTIRILEAE